jgi:hypothetical protein
LERELASLTLEALIGPAGSAQATVIDEDRFTSAPGVIIKVAEKCVPFRHVRLFSLD